MKFKMPALPKNGFMQSARCSPCRAPAALHVVLAAGGSLGGVTLVRCWSRGQEDQDIGIEVVLRPLRLLATGLALGLDYKLMPLLYRARRARSQGRSWEQQLEEVHSRCANRVYELCKANKGVYIKAAQFASARQILPRAYTDQLAVLQDQAPAQSFDKVRRVISQEFRCSWDKVFSSIEPAPVAAASLAQVHLGRLRDGREVAIKVQRAGLRGVMEADMRLLVLATAAAEFVFPALRLKWLANTFRDSLMRELDFTSEAHNASLAATMLRNQSSIKIPKVHHEFTTPRVLTMEAVNGVRVDDVPGLLSLGVRPEQVGDLVVDAFSRLLFVHGHVHLDLHPGNMLVQCCTPGTSIKDESSPVPGTLRKSAVHQYFPWCRRARNQPILVLLDHGSYAQLSPKLHKEYCRLWSSLLDHKGTPTLRDSCRMMGGGEYCEFHPMLFQGDSAAQHLSISTLSLQEKQSLEAKVKVLQETGMVASEYLKFMAALPHELMGLTKAHSLVNSVHNRLYNANVSAAARKRMHIFRQHAMDSGACGDNVRH